MTQAQPEKRPAEQGETPGLERFKPSPLPDERLAQIRARSTERYDAYDSDARWLLRYVDMLRQDNEQLRERRISFEHKIFTLATLFVGLAVIGAIAYHGYVQPTQELFPECTYQTYHSCAAWLWDYAEPLAKHPH
jgi:hypothetical protein